MLISNAHPPPPPKKGALSDEHVRRYKGVIDAFFSILKEEGMRGFYRGLPARLLYVGPAAGVSFGLYEWFRRAMVSVYDGTGDTFEPLIPIVAGASARLFGSSVKTPFDVVKQRLEVQGAIKQHRDTHVYRGTCHRSVYQHTQSLRQEPWTRSARS